MRVVSIDGLPEGGVVRLVPQEVAVQIASSGFNSPTEKLTDFRSVATPEGFQPVKGQDWFFAVPRDWEVDRPQAGSEAAARDRRPFEDVPDLHSVRASPIIRQAGPHREGQRGQSPADPAGRAPKSSISSCRTSSCSRSRT